MPAGYTGCVAGFEYGIISLSTVKAALKLQTDFRWDALIRPAVVHAVWNSDDYPQNMDRIIGPNKVWPSSGNWVPDSYADFLAGLPKDGFQLFGAGTTNWNGWQNLDEKVHPGPSDTGYVAALHSVAEADARGKYGVFCYPNENATGEFTWVPSAATCTITIYPPTASEKGRVNRGLMSQKYFADAIWTMIKRYRRKA